ncbi:MAG: ORF6N domain-containing protein, partial [Nitrospira sp.]|nr:ORF6N domain-containing protein [Nitrospira sp.]
MKRSKPIESLILTIRGHKVMIDADLAGLYGVETRTLNQAVKRNTDRFPKDFMFRLNAGEKSEVITNCDHLRRLKFAKSLPFAFTEHGAIMAATVLNSQQAVSMSVFVVRAFVQMREHIAANAAILKRLAEIDRALLEHDTALLDLYEKLLPLLQPLPDPPKPRIGFQSKGK